MITKRKNKAGFTLTETMIGLFVTSCILLTTVLMIGIIKNNEISEKYFFRSIDKKWSATQTYCQLKNNRGKIILSPSQGIIFKNGNDQKRIKLPSNLKLAKYHEINITETGYTNPQTINWYDSNGRVKYRQTVQLGWSGYKIEKIP